MIHCSFYTFCNDSLQEEIMDGQIHRALSLHGGPLAILAKLAAHAPILHERLRKIAGVRKLRAYSTILLNMILGKFSAAGYSRRA